MTRFAVDANVVVKWVTPEEHSESAARLLSEGLELWAPDLVWAESGIPPAQGGHTGPPLQNPAVPG